MARLAPRAIRFASGADGQPAMRSARLATGDGASLGAALVFGGGRLAADATVVVLLAAPRQWVSEARGSMRPAKTEHRRCGESHTSSHRCARHSADEIARP